MSKSMLLQMTGRAGRPGFDTEGVAVIMTSNQDKEFYSDLTLDVIESTLKSIFVEALCAEITQTVVQDASDAISWLRNTFFYIRSPCCYSFTYPLRLV